MRIAFVCRDLITDPEGDVARCFWDTACWLRAAGHDVVIVAEAPPGTDWPGPPPGISVVPTLGVEPERLCFGPDHEYADRVYRTLADLHRGAPLDVVEFPDRGGEGFVTIRAKRLLGRFQATRLVVRLHQPAGLVARETRDRLPSPFKAIRSFAEDYSLRRADLVTAPSVALRTYAEERLGIRPLLLRPAPPAVEDRPGDPPAPADRRIVFLGPLHPLKGADLMIEAASCLLGKDGDQRVDLYGGEAPSDPYGAASGALLRRRVPAHLRDRLVLRGPLSRADAVELLRGAPVCVMPAYWEGCPCQALRAMAHGCAVVASERGGLAEVITHGESGYLVDPRDPERTADLLLKVLADPAGLRQVSAAAREAARRWSEPGGYVAALERSYQLPAGPRATAARPSRPRVSVVIPLHNQGAFVAETVASVRRSTYDNIEVIVVNDGSDDRSTKQAFDRLQDVVKVEQPNLGVAAARNAGLAIATGELFMPLDADDLLHPAYIELAVTALLRDAELSYVTSEARYFGALDVVYVPLGSIPELMLFLHTDGKCTGLFRTDAVRAVGGYDQSLPAFEDWDLHVSLVKHGFPGDVLPAELFYYRRHRASRVFTETNFRRAELVQCLLDKHEDVLAQHAKAIAAHLVYVWKHQYEPSSSVRLQQREGEL